MGNDLNPKSFIDMQFLGYYELSVQDLSALNKTLSENKSNKMQYHYQNNKLYLKRIPATVWYGEDKHNRQR